MNGGTPAPQTPAPPRAAAGPSRLLRRAVRDGLGVGRALHRRRLMRQGYDPTRTWRVRKSGGYLTLLVLTFLGALLLLFLAVTAVITLPQEKGFDSPVRWIDDQCSKPDGFSCTVLQSLFMPFLTLALATVTYLFFRFSHVRRAYLNKARWEPHELVETAGGIFGRVVGRDQLCAVLMEDLRDRRFRRTHVVVGGIGTGKTALVVLLTQRLAERGAVPVPLRLRAAEKDLDFRRLAFDRFCREVQGSIRSAAEAEKVWRRLSQQGRIVVLADGLDEALTADELTEERDTIIRLAIRRANEEGLPLIITSRPHDSLRGMEASLTELEPLSEEAALTYISSGGSGEDRQRLDWIVERAGIAEAPTYLEIAAELHEQGLLERALVAGPVEEEAVETRGGDRASLRFHLFETWLSALVSGRFQPQLPLSPEERRSTVHYLSAMACVGLALDTSEVRFSDVVDEQDPARSRFPEIVRELARRVGDTGIDLRLAAHWGARMDLVELGGDRVRFQHSVIQAQLGARFLNAVIHPDVPAQPTDGFYFPAALRRPGRELLIAMVLHSRLPDGACVHDEPGAADPDGTLWCPVSATRDLLLEAACQAQTVLDSHRHDDGARPFLGRTLHSKALELYAAALEIDSVDAEPEQHLIAMRLCTSWPDLRARDPHTLRTAKALLVSRFGEAVRGVAQRRTLRPAYLELFEIACLEPSYAVRLAIAQEIGAGGDLAFEALQPRLRGPRIVEALRVERGENVELELYARQQPELVGERETRLRRRGEGQVARMRRELKEREEQRRRERRREREDREAEERQWRDNVLCAWLVPLLVGSVTTHRHQDTPYTFLESWVRRVGIPEDSADAHAALDLSVEVALAQGFKYAANRRHRHPHARPEAREYLSEQAWDMLRRTRFWFTRLTLLHALTLWDLPDVATAPSASRSRGSDPAQQVRQWLARPDGEPEHPFVTAAGKLCVWALETRRPERFLWIDESGVAAHVGSQTSGGEARKHNLWIPPSAGWSALHPSAQQLLADVLLLLNLAERGDWPADRIRRLQHTARPDLPPCLTTDRAPLDPRRTVARTVSSQAGSNCRDDCAFELCPYPPKGLDEQRAELGEAFCRAQSTLLSSSRSGLRPKAPWQRRTSLAELRDFWEQMGHRAQHDARPR
ncbi:NACHT domain-containing protein [Streptomyces sp. NPDC057794]|uniref:NACHT domain-containing protein n=1 Tax=Streptomyces sp. NPDC057794 TaxID=3346251 RepID=UPI0036C497A5